MSVVDADHHASKFTRNPPVSVPVLCEGLLLRQHEIKCDSLPACTVEVLRPVPWEAFDGPDVRKVRAGPVLAHHPEAGVAPAGPGVQAPLKVIDLAAPLRWLTNLVKNRVISFDERHEVGVVTWVRDAISVLVPV